MKRKYDMKLLAELLKFSDTYDISIQFWVNQTAVYIEKDGIELKDYGGDFEFAITSATDYLKRINRTTCH